MPTYRTLHTDDERRQHAAIAAYAFNDDRSDAAIDRRVRNYEPDWCYAALDGPEMVAGLVVIPFEQHINGARIPMGGVASVSCLPERRRQGLVGGLLRHTLADMRERGQPLSALYTPHTALYRRFGWATASRIVSYAFEPKRVRLRIAPGAGAMRRVAAGDWRTLATVYDAHVAALNGPVARDERRWRYVLHEGRDAAVWHDAAGEPRGYVVYRVGQRSGADGWPSEEPYQQLRVVDWAALDARAYAVVLD
jgi:predicted acetyltransferase